MTAVVFMWVDIVITHHSSNSLPIHLGCGGIFGSQPSSMAWLQTNLPLTLSKMSREQEHVKHLYEDSQTMEAELERERNLNKELQEKIAARRKKNDEMCALATMLRSETEAVLARYVLLRMERLLLACSKEREHLLTFSLFQSY